jgi:hypothetical protein
VGAEAGREAGGEAGLGCGEGGAGRSGDLPSPSLSPSMAPPSPRTTGPPSPPSVASSPLLMLSSLLSPRGISTLSPRALGAASTAPSATVLRCYSYIVLHCMLSHLVGNVTMLRAGRAAGGADAHISFSCSFSALISSFICEELPSARLDVSIRFRFRFLDVRPP